MFLFPAARLGERNLQRSEPSQIIRDLKYTMLLFGFIEAADNLREQCEDLNQQIEALEGNFACRITSLNKQL